MIPFHLNDLFDLTTCETLELEHSVLVGQCHVQFSPDLLPGCYRRQDDYAGQLWLKSHLKYPDLQGIDPKLLCEEMKVVFMAESAFSYSKSAWTFSCNWKTSTKKEVSGHVPYWCL